ncbi:maleylpyruvate isomerase family mycothiol-dependent enzyme [Modestobacter sp. I12A-02628]|uniref:Maleylpyruvate isomerase family protein n=1 Tax=Goekera deserti TaxID=2497753 RepID=A0A7K3WLI5_9ACTN|nr:maleylpyruvate isomerase N-terminal domain-containing protein [Goekera deserti]MPQ97056.1 maleylpyruvate isomerase family mycothiol-dependent enzyme [Goekera deserti]NDI46627.1 maleylpyruvate isomerase family mycothiol-dependent enzyme [Goekera deserti]NEL56383.1 maleylpyruvate isomerase family protein [Goekera deserti]
MTTRTHGMADAGRDEVGRRVLAAWDAFLAQATAADLSRPTRLPGWRVHDVCVHLGVWHDHAALADLVAGAHAGGSGAPPDVDAVNARVVGAHRDAARAEVLAALQRARQATADLLAREPAWLDTAPTMSTVGRLPLLGVVFAQCYELAVHGLDLQAAGAPAVAAEVLHSGLGALADVTGALAAACSITTRTTLATPDGGWSSAAGPDGWTLRAVPAGPVTGTGVEAAAPLLLEAAAGRTNPVAALARRRLVLHDLPGLLALAPIVHAAPGIPGGPVLQLAARTLGGAGGLLGRLRGR